MIGEGYAIRIESHLINSYRKKIYLTALTIDKKFFLLTLENCGGCIVRKKKVIKISGLEVQMDPSLRIR